MRFELIWTPDAQFKYQAMKRAAQESAANRVRSKTSKSSKQEGLFKQVFKCVQFLSSNPRHVGLATHEFRGLEHPYDPKQKVFEAYVQNKTPGAYRIFWCYGPKPKQITIMNITAHT